MFSMSNTQHGWQLHNYFKKFSEAGLATGFLLLVINGNGFYFLHCTTLMSTIARKTKNNGLLRFF